MLIMHIIIIIIVSIAHRIVTSIAWGCASADLTGSHAHHTTANIAIRMSIIIVFVVSMLPHHHHHHDHHYGMRPRVARSLYMHHTPVILVGNELLPLESHSSSSPFLKEVSRDSAWASRPCCVARSGSAAWIVNETSLARHGTCCIG